MESKWLNCNKQELGKSLKQERSICHPINNSHFIKRVYSIKTKGEGSWWEGKRKNIGRKRQRHVLLMPLLASASFGKMDCIVFISLMPCVSLMINFYFSVYDSFPISYIRILLIVSERENTQVPITHWGYPPLPWWNTDRSLNELDILPRFPLKSVQSPPGRNLCFTNPAAHLHLGI